MNPSDFPTSQSELLRRARGDRSQAAFARLLGVDRTCLSRYESEALGAPTAVLNYCLRLIAGVDQSVNADRDLAHVLINARRLVAQLEGIQRDPPRRATRTAKLPGKTP